jgi:transposase
MKKQEVYISIKKEEFEQILSSLEFLRQRVEDLELQLSKTSKNSSKPPSSVGYKKEVKNNRVKSGLKPGAQKGTGAAH